MTIEFVCHQCGHEFHIPRTFAGATGRCEKCGATVSIPKIHAADDTAVDLAAYEVDADAENNLETTSETRHPNYPSLTLLRYVLLGVTIVVVVTICVMLAINITQGVLEAREEDRLTELVDTTITNANTSADANQFAQALQALHDALGQLASSELNTSEHRLRLRQEISTRVFPI